MTERGFIGCGDLCDVSKRETVCDQAVDHLPDKCWHLGLELGRLATTASWLTPKLDV
jgi:hypothetical protein